MLAATLLTGCKDESAEPIDPADAAITVATSAFSIDNATHSKATATFTVNTGWTTAVSYEGNTQGWLSVTPQSGRAGEEIEITLKATAKNPSDANRIAYVDICYADKTHRLTITQTIDPDIDITARFDADFAKTLKERGYIPNAEKIKLSDVKDIKKIDVSPPLHFQDYYYCSLTSLSGIEYFSDLDTLLCYGNQLTTLDVSKNTALKQLDCSSNQLTILDVSKNTALDCLYCLGNQLTSLDVSKNTALTGLYCSDNQLTALDISNNTALEWLFCYNNQLTFLDISNNTALTGLSYYNNPGNGTVFPVTAWFDNNSIPLYIYISDEAWIFNGNQIIAEYIKK